MKKLLVAAALILATGSAGATPPPRGGVMWIDATGRVAAPYLPNNQFYFDDAGRIWQFGEDLSISPWFSAYPAFYQSGDCTGAAYGVFEYSVNVSQGFAVQLGGLLGSTSAGLYSIPTTTTSTMISLGSAWNGSTCVVDPWPHGSRNGWLISSLTAYADGIPPPLTGPLHLEWR